MRTPYTNTHMYVSVRPTLGLLAYALSSADSIWGCFERMFVCKYLIRHADVLNMDFVCLFYGCAFFTRSLLVGKFLKTSF